MGVCDPLIPPESTPALVLSTRRIHDAELRCVANRFSHLRVLNLADNDLRTFPLSICSITTLSQLNLASNKLDVIPPSICKLKQSVYVAVSRLSKFFSRGNRCVGFINGRLPSGPGLVGCPVGSPPPPPGKNIWVQLAQVCSRAGCPSCQATSQSIKFCLWQNRNSPPSFVVYL